MGPYAFHPVEALIQAGIYVVIVFALPMPPAALMLFLTYMIVRNVIGHLGFEIWPAGFARHPLTRWHLTPTHHDQHHRGGKGNYGLYFRFWDNWMGTGRSDYEVADDARGQFPCEPSRATAPPPPMFRAFPPSLGIRAAPDFVRAANTPSRRRGPRS